MTPTDDPARAERERTCPHGMTYEQRRANGCSECDAYALEMIRREQDAAQREDARRLQVVETARAAFMVYAAAQIEYRPQGTTFSAAALSLAESFERAASRYLESGAPDDAPEEGK